MNIRIYYDGGLNTKLDLYFETMLKDLHFKRWASGMSMENGERDLAFEYRPENPDCPDPLFTLPLQVEGNENGEVMSKPPSSKPRR